LAKRTSALFQSSTHGSVLMERGSTASPRAQL
jgi:hypothetical protein